MSRPRTVIKVEGRRTWVAPSVGEEELTLALSVCGWHISAVAKYLGVHRSTVYRLLDRYGIVAFLDVKEQT